MTRDDHGPLVPGCHIDGHHGHYVGPMALQLAVDHGYALDAETAKALAEYEDFSHCEWFPHELLTDETDRAVAWLNDQRGLDGHSWQFMEGDFGLYPDDDDECEVSS